MLFCWILTPWHLAATMALCCVKIQQTQAKPWLNSSDLCKSLLRLMKPTPQSCSTTSRKRNPETRPPTAVACATTRGQWLLEFSHASPQILDSQARSQSHALPRRPCRPPIYLAWESGGHTTLHAPPGFLAAPPRASEHCTLLPRADTAADVIWRHQMTLSLHVSRHASTSAALHSRNLLNLIKSQDFIKLPSWVWKGVLEIY